MSKFIEVIQNGYKDCGPSCLLSIIRYFGGNTSHEELALLLRTDNNGTTAYNLISGAKSLGFDGYGIKYSYEDIISNNIIYPIIVHVLVKNMYHYIVIYEVNVNKKKLYVMDPSIGLTYISFEYFNNIYQGTSIVLYPVKKICTLDNMNKITNYIYEYIKEDRKFFIIFILLSISSILLSILSNYYLQIIIDRILPDYFYKELIIVTFLFLNIMILKSVFGHIRGKYLINISNKIGIKINNETIRHIFNLPYQFFKNKSTGEVISRIGDIKELKEILSNIIVSLSTDILLIILSIIVLFVINIKLFIITIIIMMLYYLIVKMYSKKFKREINSFQICNGEYNKMLTESIEGYESNKNIGVTDSIIKSIEMKYIVYTKKYSLFENSLNNQLFFKDVLMNICYILTIFIGTIYINEGIISLGNFIVFNSVITFFTEPIKNILDLEPNLSYMKGVINRINDLLVMKSNSFIGTNINLKGDIIINNLSYSYNGINNIIDNVNIKIKYKDKFLIYGSSGNGKSTLLKLILKYLSDYDGKIMIGNINILDIDESIITSSFTYVSQNNYLNNDTLKNNIIYGRNISDEEYEKVINICHVNRLRDSKTLRNNFIIEDNGFNISGGERQKIILARALLKNSNYIILDEALSEVGFNEEKEILNKIINNYRDKTIIYVSHKKEIIELFDNKYYLERRKT